MTECATSTAAAGGDDDAPTSPDSVPHVYGPFPRSSSDAFANASLFVGPSTIRDAGRGVYAVVNIPRNTMIGRYSGIGMTKAAIDSLYGKRVARYTLTVTCSSAADCGWPHSHVGGASAAGAEHVPHTVCIDAQDSGHWAALINDGFHSGIVPNVRFGEDGAVRTTTTIAAGAELFVSYGGEYW